LGLPEFVLQSDGVHEIASWLKKKKKKRKKKERPGKGNGERSFRWNLCAGRDEKKRV